MTVLMNFCMVLNQGFPKRVTQMEPMTIGTSKSGGAYSLIILLKKKMIHLKQIVRTERQMLALTANVTINSIIIKPREKGKQILESVTELFKFSLMLIVGRLRPLK